MVEKTATKKSADTKAPAKKKAVKKTVKKTAPKKESSAQAQDDTFAVIATGGKQYTVAVGDTLSIEVISGDHAEGDSVTFDKVLLVESGNDTSIGDPYVQGAKVTATIDEIGRARKVDAVQYKAKSRAFKRKGHRQPFMKVTITKIQ